jgi:hypothetical protein
MLIDFCRSWQVPGEFKSPGIRMPPVAPRAKRPHLQAQTEPEPATVDRPPLNDNRANPRWPDKSINILSANFAIFRAKPMKPYLEMLQSFAPWKSALNEGQ